MNFRKELDLALQSILELPLELQDIVAMDIVATVKSRIATMRTIALRTRPLRVTHSADFVSHSQCERLNTEQSK